MDFDKKLDQVIEEAIRPGGPMHDRSMELFQNSWRDLLLAAKGLTSDKAEQIRHLLATTQVELKKLM